MQVEKRDLGGVLKDLQINIGVKEAERQIGFEIMWFSNFTLTLVGYDLRKVYSP